MKDLKGTGILITGASSGIGRQLAISIAKLNPDFMILVARRIEKLKEIEKICNGIKIISIKADLSNKDELVYLFNQLEPFKENITHVFNNAGLGWYGFFDKMENQKIEEMINVNNLSLTLITKYFLECSNKTNKIKKLHIFNIGSIAEYFPVQGIAIYSATKSFVDAFTKSLQSEYAKNKNIFFTLVLPGAIKTEFFDVAQNSNGAQKIKLNLFELEVEKAVKYIIKGIFNKKKVIYIPSIFKIIPLIGFLFGKAIRSLGPILLDR